MLNHTAGLLTASDTLSLAAGFVVEAGYLIDPIGARHQLQAGARQILLALSQPISADEWTSTGTDGAALSDIVLFLNSIGALRVQRTWRGYLQALYFQLHCVLLGIRPERLGRRWAATWLGGMAATLQAFLPLLFLSGILGGVAGASRIASISQLAWLVFFWAATIGTVMVHEQAHLWPLGDIGRRAVYIVRGRQYGVLHVKATPSRELAAAIAGPFAGAGSSLSAGTCVYAFTGQTTSLVIGALVALFHLVQVLPLFADGRVVFQELLGVKI